GVDGEKARRHALPEGRTPAARIIALGPLDFDHVRAHVGEDLRGDGSGQILRDLDDRDALERKHVLNLRTSTWPPHPALFPSGERVRVRVRVRGNYRDVRYGQSASAPRAATSRPSFIAQ